MVYTIGLAVVMVLFRVLFRYKVEGKEILRAYRKNGRRFILCPNHRSNFDSFFVLMAYGFGKKMTIMAKQELFSNPLFTWFFKQIGAFPVDRGNADMTAINNAIEEVKGGRGMLLFPEGARGASDEMGKVKTGAFLIAAKSGADIIPMRIIYPNKDRKAHWFGKVVIKIGQPMKSEDMNLVEGGKHALRQAKIAYRQEMDDLLKEYNDSVGYVPPQENEQEKPVIKEAENENN